MADVDQRARIDAIRARNQPPPAEPPACRVCGDLLTLGDVGNGRAKFACYPVVGEKVNQARTQHYRESIVEIRLPDPDVRELLAIAADLEATNARLVAVLQKINADVSFGICVVGHKGKDAAIRRIGQAVDRALVAASSPGTPAAGEA